MAQFAISTRSLSKVYQLGPTGANIRGLLSERMERAIRTPFARLLNARPAIAPHPLQRQIGEIWALRDITFDIRPGEVVALIGSNGAGKSTLLKVLSRVVAPSYGEAQIRGRVGSLLEVGAGFHGELTGHENIFLNGALIGMSRDEIRKKYDEIVDFSGIDKFLGTPVKYYSSGMFLRLAFSIAATLETEILFLDEVMSVGDAEFQAKSRKRMREILRSGRTVILVSHDSSAVRSYCTRAIWLKNGEIVDDGPVDRTVAEYVDTVLVSEDIPLGQRVWPDMAKAPGSDIARLLAVRLTTEGGSVVETVSSDEEFCIEIEYESRIDDSPLNTSFTIFDSNNYALFTANNFRGAFQERDGDQRYGKGRYIARCWIPPLFLNAGEFTFYVNVIHKFQPVAEADRCVRIIIKDGRSMREEYEGPWPYPLRPRLQWGTFPAE